MTNYTRKEIATLLEDGPSCDIWYDAKGEIVTGGKGVVVAPDRATAEAAAQHAVRRSRRCPPRVCSLRSA